MAVENIYIDSINIEKLKGLKNVSVEIERNGLTAIMGVNGIGKSTILHALACVFKPKFSDGENYKFPVFFPPNPDATWKDSRFEVKCTILKNELHGDVVLTKQFCKGFDRWSPRYENRLSREVYYIGIKTCVPIIEEIGLHGALSYESKIRDDNIAKKVIENAAFILDKDYQNLMLNSSWKGILSGVERKSGVKYSSLSMGCGEQRLLKILETVEKAKKYSLILIDEIDLLLHVDALRRLIYRLNEIAEDKKLQIVFTTHSTIVLDMKEMVFINYLALKNNNIQIFHGVNSDCLSMLLGEPARPIKIYVEDCLSKTIVKHIAQQLDMNKKISVFTFGSVSNAYLIATSKIIENCGLSNTLIILDGDKDRLLENKEKQLKKYFSGTESDRLEKINKAIAVIAQFRLPENTSPEEFLYNEMVDRNCPNDVELVNAINRNKHVVDRHDYIRKIKTNIN